MNFNPRTFPEDYTKDLLDTKKPLNPLDRQAYMEGHIRVLELAFEGVRAGSYLSHFDYVDWNVGDDDVLRLGDHINCNRQDQFGADVSTFDGKIVMHDETWLPVILYNVENGDEENSGEFADINDLFMRGYDFTRLVAPHKESEAV